MNVEEEIIIQMKKIPSLSRAPAESRSSVIP